jgi:hypothetical protein
MTDAELVAVDFVDAGDPRDATLGERETPRLEGWGRLSTPSVT